MNKIFWHVNLLLLLACEIFAWDLSHLKPLQLSPLSDEEKRVIIDGGTERPFSGKYYKHNEDGTYTCKQCGAALYRSGDKFDSGCGWPSFDDEIKGAIKRLRDKDGKRVEIRCAKCDAHLGHVFHGEGFTAKNTRHCVNSISLGFEPKAVLNEAKAYFAGGCFWGVEYYMEQQKGVKSVVSGFMGGHVKNPSYKDVVYKKTGHLETVEVTYDPKVVSYETLAKLFFEIHDPTQSNGQGPDIGSQYLSAVFVANEAERQTVEKLIAKLQQNGFKVATKILSASEFYRAEEQHQDYYKRHNKAPYCHGYVKRFKD